MTNPRRSSRRDFLKGQAARDAVEDFAEGFQAELPRGSDTTAEPGQETYLLQIARDAMAVEFQVLLNAGEHGQAPESAVAALDLVERLEAQMTVYRDSSEVSRINRTAFEKAVPVEPRLFQLFQAAQRIAVETGGAYDMTSGPLSKVWGFYRRQGRMPDDAEITATLGRVGYQRLVLDKAQQTIRFDVTGMELNLGGIGKGHALDRMSELLVADGVADFLLHGGRSSVLARGSRAGAPVDHPGWIVGLAHPLRSGERLAEFRLHNQALGTSGSGTQFFHHGGRRYGHILDPRSGRPAEGVLSSTVIAPTAAEADALSTALYVGGRELARKYCEAHAECSAILVTPSRTAAKLDLEEFNLAGNSWQRVSE